MQPIDFALALLLTGVAGLAVCFFRMSRIASEALEIIRDMRRDIDRMSRADELDDAWEDPEGYTGEGPTGDGPPVDCEPWLTNG